MFPAEGGQKAVKIVKLHYFPQNTLSNGLSNRL
jgi:hypothetical protein